jgi:hypothetical protein
MIRRGLLTVCLFCFLLSISGVNGAGQVPMNPTDGVYGNGDWKYQFVVLGRGTPDEKAVGKLSFKGKEVIGNNYDRIRSPMGEFMWSGSACDQSRWGWYRIDPQKKYAKWQRVKIDESQNGAVWRTIRE